MTSFRLQVADLFRQHKQEFFARWGHTLFTQQSKVFRDICACRTAALGARFARCKTRARREELPGSGKGICPVRSSEISVGGTRITSPPSTSSRPIVNGHVLAFF